MQRTFIENRPYLYASLALALLVLIFHLLTPWGMEDDYWETSAAVQEISRSPLHPQNPLLALGEGTSPRIVPYTIIWGVIMRIAGLKLSTIMILAAIVNILLLTSGIYRFIVRQFRDDRLPLYVMGSMLLVWGVGYSQANAYQIEVLAWAAPYVGISAFALCFHALAYLREYVDDRRLSSLTLYSALAIIAFLTHPITAAFLFVVAFVILLEEEAYLDLLLLQVVPLISLAACLIWPYFDYWTVLTRGASEAWFVSPMFSNRPAALGTAIVGIPILIYFALHRRALFLSYGFAICGLIYFASDALNILIGGRFLFWAMVFAHIAIAIFALERSLLHLTTWRESLMHTGLVFVLATTVLGPALAHRAGKLAHYAVQAVSNPITGPNYMRMPDPFYFLKSRLHADNIVMADERSSWVIPSLTGARIVVQAKGNPLIQDEIFERKADARSFFQDSLSLVDRRTVLQKYGATHIVVNRADPDSLNKTLVDALDSLANLVERSGLVELHAVMR